MQQRMQTMSEAARQIRMVHIALLFAVFVYGVIGEKFLQHPATGPDDTFVAGICVAALGAVASGFLIRQRKISLATEILQRTPDDPVAIGWWKYGNIIGSTIAEAVALFGFALRVLGAQLKVSAAFYMAALALMVIWWPREP